MNFRFIMVAICGVRMVLTLDMMISLYDYEDPRDFVRDECLDSCEFHAPD